MAAVPFPTKQLFILALCRICEPIAFMSIFPYVYYMVRSFDITTSTEQLAFYAGMVTSSFAFAEFSSGVVWGRISDRIGRKPVLLCGLAGTALSMLVFGLAPSLPVAMLGRALGGLLNGNMGVLQTTVAEIVTVKEHQPRAYSIMPFVWCLGSVLGPALGGSLAQPHENYPAIFSKSSIFGRYPFLLPNLVCAMILACGVLIGLLFLEETHPKKKHNRDFGIELGRWLLRQFGSQSASARAEKETLRDPLIVEPVPEDDPPMYRSTESTPRNSLSRSPSPVAEGSSRNNKASFGPRTAGVNRAFTSQVINIIVGFGILAYHSISFDQLMPVLLSEPISHQAASLPFRFTGGFGLSSKSIGFMLSVQGIYSIFAQPMVFPYTARTFGTLKTYRFVIIAWPLLNFLVPYMILLPLPLQKPAIYASLLCKITFHVLAFPASAILLTNAAPSTLVLGSINGVAASTASLARALGPTLTGLVHAWGLNVGCTGLAWWLNGIICAVGAVQSFSLQEVTNGRMDSTVDEEKDEEQATLADGLGESRHIITERDIKTTREQHDLPQSDRKTPYSDAT